MGYNGGKKQEEEAQSWKRQANRITYNRRGIR